MSHSIDSLFTWKPIKRRGYEEYKLPFATVFSNGVWHTWDENGSGGENSKEETVERAKVEAIASAFHQGFIRAHIAKASKRIDKMADISVSFGEDFLRLIEASIKFEETLQRYCSSDPILQETAKETFDGYRDNLKNVRKKIGVYMKDMKRLKEEE